MVDIQSTTTEIRRGKKKEETTGRKYNGLPYSIGRPQIVYDHLIEAAPSLQMMHTLALHIVDLAPGSAKLHTIEGGHKKSCHYLHILLGIINMQH